MTYTVQDERDALTTDLEEALAGVQHQLHLHRAATEMGLKTEVSHDDESVFVVVSSDDLEQLRTLRSLLGRPRMPIWDDRGQVPEPTQKESPP